MGNTLEDISNFVSACDNMTESKYIFVNKRIADVLKAIAQDKPIYNAIASCMINFNFASEWKMATARAGSMTMPADRSKMIAFVFCLLKGIDDGKINISETLVKYFSSGMDNRSNYTIFCERVIVPFKNALITIVCGADAVKVVAMPTKSEEKPLDMPVVANFDKKIAERLEFLAKDVKAYIIGLKRMKKTKISKQTYLRLVDILVKFAGEGNIGVMLQLAESLKECTKDKELVSRLQAIIDLTKGE